MEDKNNVVDIDEDFPYIPKDLLERNQKDFDIRKMIWYSDDRNLLMGIQQVISYLEDHYNKQLINGDN